MPCTWCAGHPSCRLPWNRAYPNKIEIARSLPKHFA